VRTTATPPYATGEYRWSGAGGTFFLVDPQDDLFVIVMVRAPLGQNEIEVRRLVYEALTP
jgi:CubicO group peptidase (beta-lactamase class C family)